MAQAKEEKALYGNLVERLQDAAKHHEVMAVLKSEGITGAHVERHVRQLFLDRARRFTATKTVSSPVIRNPRHQFIADNWNKPAKQLAEELNSSIPAVHMAAKVMGLPPKSRFWHSRPHKLAAGGSENKKRVASSI